MHGDSPSLILVRVHLEMKLLITAILLQQLYADSKKLILLRYLVQKDMQVAQVSVDHPLEAILTHIHSSSIFPYLILTYARSVVSSRIVFPFLILNSLLNERQHDWHIASDY